MHDRRNRRTAVCVTSQAAGTARYCFGITTAAQGGAEVLLRSPVSRTGCPLMSFSSIFSWDFVTVASA
jgi:hypothetical protein